MRFMIIGIIILSIISCSEKNYSVKFHDGVKFITNKNIPMFDNIELKLNKIYTIIGNSDAFEADRILLQPDLIKMDSENNLYIADIKTLSIKAFDSKGNFKRSIAKKGVGPGELNWMSDFLINDNLYIFDNSKYIKVFSLDGNFIQKVPFATKSIDICHQIVNITDTTYISSALGHIQRNDDISIVRKASIFDYNGLEVFNIYGDTLAVKEFHKYPEKLINMDYILTSDKEVIYISKKNKNIYNITGYNFSGEKIIDITKYYRKISFSEQEKSIIKSKTSGQMLEIFNKVYDYKFSVYNLLIDKYRNIWVQLNEKIGDENIFFDIFSSEGVYIGKYSLKNEFNNYANTKLYFFNNLMLTVDYDTLEISVYKYDLIKIN